MRNVYPELQMEKEYSAYVMINYRDSSDADVMEQLRKIKELTEIQPTVGTYDILVKIESSKIDHIRDIIARKIRTMEKIRSVTTLICA
jgi:DNA-binding Lrp family transcriptional regulator